VESQVQVPVASESTNKTNCSLRASAIRFRAPVASGLAPTEPPTTVQPLHRLGLGSPRCQHSRTGMSPAERAIPCVRLQEPPRRAQGLALVASESARPCHRINPASAVRTSQTYSNQLASDRRRRACHHGNGRDRRVAPEYQGQDRSIDHTATVTSYRARTCCLCQKRAPRSKHMYRPCTSL